MNGSRELRSANSKSQIGTQSRTSRRRVSPAEVKSPASFSGNKSSLSNDSSPSTLKNSRCLRSSVSKRVKLSRNRSSLYNSTPSSSSKLNASESEDSKSPSSSNQRRSGTTTSIRRSTRSADYAKKKVKQAIKSVGRLSNSSKPGPSSVIKNSENPSRSKRKCPSNDSNGEKLNDSIDSDEEVFKVNSLGVPVCPLPCREVQFENIWSFLKKNIRDKNSGCLYVSGVPGSGKTAIVQSVIETLEKMSGQSLFKHVYINGLSLGSPERIWKRFYHGLHHDKIKLTAPTALKKLGSYFESTSSRVPVVLVIDELDQLLDKQQSILYTLLEWASHDSTMLSLVAIFNTMNVPENVFASRNSSRMGFSRVVFPPYKHDQLETIVSNSLAAHTTIKLNPEAITLLSKKVAALSGDARRALEISKRAVEIVEGGTNSGIKAVDEAFKEIFTSPKIDTVKDCSMLEQMFLKTVSHEQQRTGLEETTLMTVQSSIVMDAAYEGMQWSVDQFLTAASKLVSMKLIVAENDSSSLHKKISLNIPVEDINYALGINANSVNGEN